MAVKFSNNAKTTLSSGITSSATSIAVVDASAWPTLGSGDYTLCTFITVADPDVLEIVKVTAISGNTLTVVRAQEGTTARAFASADKAELRVTAGLLEQALTGTDVVKLDSLTASATASYSMAVGGVAYSPSNVNALIVSLNGVTQEPTDAFTISGSTLTFASALTSADSIDYIVDLAKTLDIGEPSDNTVSPAKLTSAVNLDAITDNGATTTNAVTVGSLTSTGIDDNATSTAITIDANENVGIGVTDPDATLEVHMPDSATGPYFHGGGSRGLRIADSTITNAGDRTEFYKPTSSGMFSFKNSLKELLTIKSSGRIGSDETNPQDRIHIKGSLPALRLENTAGAADSYTRIAGIDGALRIQADQGNSTANSFIAFDVDTVERMRVDSSGSVNITGSVISDAVRTDGTSFSSNVDSAYLIAGTSGWTGATTNWDTYGFQHKIKTDGSGVVRLTIDTHLGEKFSMKNNGETTFSGNVGIGTTTPTRRLYVKSDQQIVQTFESTAAHSYISFVNATTAENRTRIGVQGTDTLVFRNAASDRMTIDSSGNLLLGKTTGASTIRAQFVGASSTSANSVMLLEDSSLTDLFEVRCDGRIMTGTGVASPYNQTVSFSANVWVNSAGVLYRQSSSARYKENIQDMTFGLSELMSLRPVTFEANTENTGLKFGGFIAEEVHDTGLVEFVEYNDEGQPDAVGYANMVSLLTKAIQEQQAIIEDLQTRLSALEAN